MQRQYFFIQDLLVDEGWNSPNIAINTIRALNA